MTVLKDKWYSLAIVATLGFGMLHKDVIEEEKCCVVKSHLLLLLVAEEGFELTSASRAAALCAVAHRGLNHNIATLLDPWTSGVL